MLKLGVPERRLLNRVVLLAGVVARSHPGRLAPLSGSLCSALPLSSADDDRDVLCAKEHLGYSIQAATTASRQSWFTRCHQSRLCGAYAHAAYKALYYGIPSQVLVPQAPAPRQAFLFIPRGHELGCRLALLLVLGCSWREPWGGWLARGVSHARRI